MARWSWSRGGEASREVAKRGRGKRSEREPHGQESAEAKRGVNQGRASKSKQERAGHVLGEQDMYRENKTCMERSGHVRGDITCMECFRHILLPLDMY